MVVFNLGGDEIPWDSILIPVLLVACIVVFLGFLQHERNFALPVLPISLLRGRHMTSQIGLNLFGAMAIFAVSHFRTTKRTHR